MNKPGVTLIELVFGLMLSSIIVTLLYNIFLVTTRGISIAEPLMEYDIPSVIIYNQLTKELQGLCIPTQTEAVQQSKDQPTKGKPEDVPVDKIFYSINNNNSLSLLSFISNNPMYTYHDPAKGVSTPLLVRIAYSLKPNNKGNFSLIRQESNSLNLDAFNEKAPNPIRGYELANNIKNISMEYTFPVQEEKPKESKDEKEKAVRYEKRSEWRFEEWKKKDGAKAPPQFPQYITMTITMTDRHRNEHQVAFKFELLQTFTTAAPASSSSSSTGKDILKDLKSVS